VASYPGPITRSAAVFAATTPSGDWYVFALERAYVHDGVSPAEGASRGLALVNAKAAGEAARIIDIGTHLESDSVSPDWSRVAWTGPALDAGRRAAAAAIDCLDARS
jgi:hypothetical protein